LFIYKKMKFLIYANPLSFAGVNYTAMDILCLWKSLVDDGYKVRKDRLDGRKMWQSYREHYSKMYQNEENLNTNIKIFNLSQEGSYSSYDKDHEVVSIKIGDDLLLNDKETDHFIVQHFRIPIMFGHKIPLLKLLQIAYNVGQAKAEFERGTYSEGVVKYYKDNKLGELSTYIEMP